MEFVRGRHKGVKLVRLTLFGIQFLAALKDSDWVFEEKPRGLRFKFKRFVFAIRKVKA